jgi:uncharacterized membrane protein YbhN (UPF0104 family)
MTPRARRLVAWLAAAVLVALTIQWLGRFEWGRTWRYLLAAEPALLAAATAVNLTSLVAKGWAWQLLLRTARPVGWWKFQKANLVGSAATILGGSMVGEAARAREVVVPSKTPWPRVIGSVVQLRATEGLGFVLFMAAAPFFFSLPEAMRVTHVIAIVALGFLLLIARSRGWRPIVRRLPRALQNRIGNLSFAADRPRISAAIGLVNLNWITQWATYGLVLDSLHIHEGGAGALSALLAANLSWLLQIPAGKMGVFQAAIVVGLVPFGVPAEQAITAGIVLQAIQVLPVLLLTTTLLGWRGLVRLRNEPALTTAESPSRRVPAGPSLAAGLARGRRTFRAPSKPDVAARSFAGVE